MTLEEAKRILDPKTSREALEEIEYYHGFDGERAKIEAVNDAIKIACEAIDKQITKKPEIVIKDNKYQYCCCPNCGNEYIVAGLRYCVDCGQRLDWGEEK